jgi:hypothetical protein
MPDQALPPKEEANSLAFSRFLLHHEHKSFIRFGEIPFEQLPQTNQSIFGIS